jgi:ankyrin repeat protein
MEGKMFSQNMSSKLILVILLFLALSFVCCSQKESKEAQTRKASAQVKESLAQPEFVAAAKNGDVEAVKAFIRKGADVNSKDPKGGLPVFLLAADEGHLDVVREFISAGVDVNKLRDVQDSTALFSASWRGRVDVVKEFISAGADVNARNSSQGTPVMYAAKFNGAMTGRPEVIQELLKAGAEIDAKNRRGETALHEAASGDIEVFRILLDAGADVNAASEPGQTPLMMAAQAGKPEIIQELLERKANINAVDTWDQWTALQWASSSGQLEAVSLLVKNGAEIHHKDKNGKTALALAQEKGQTKVAELLKAAGGRE